MANIKGQTNKKVKELGVELKDEKGNIARKEAEHPEVRTPRRTEAPSEKLSFRQKRREKRERKGLVAPRYESWNPRVNECALKLANRFPAHKLILAVDSPSKAPEIYGYLKNTYRDHEWLVDNLVIEVASYFAQHKLEHKIRIVRVITEIHLDEYKWARVELEGIHTFENYPTIPFTDAFFLCEEYFDDAIYWINDAEWILDNEDVRINLGRFSASLICWASWNIPVFLVRDIPFSNKALFKATVDAKKIKDAKMEAQARIINSYRSRISSYDDEIDQFQRDSREWKKMYDDLQKSRNLEYRKMIERRQAQGLGIPHRRGSMYGLTILLIVLGILAIIGFMT